jgi:hypothetical protein
VLRWLEGYTAVVLTLSAYNVWLGSPLQLLLGCARSVGIVESIENLGKLALMTSARALVNLKFSASELLDNEGEYPCHPWAIP